MFRSCRFFINDFALSDRTLAIQSPALRPVVLRIAVEKTFRSQTEPVGIPCHIMMPAINLYEQIIKSLKQDALTGYFDRVVFSSIVCQLVEKYIKHIGNHPHSSGAIAVNRHLKRTHDCHNLPILHIIQTMTWSEPILVKIAERIMTDKLCLQDAGKRRQHTGSIDVGHHYFEIGSDGERRQRVLPRGSQNRRRHIGRKQRKPVELYLKRQPPGRGRRRLPMAIRPGAIEKSADPIRARAFLL